MIGLSPAPDFWNGGSDLATRSAWFSSLGGGNTEYILIPGGKLPDSTDDQKRHAKYREGTPERSVRDCGSMRTRLNSVSRGRRNCALRPVS